MKTNVAPMSSVHFRSIFIPIHDVELLKLKVLPNDVKENNTFATSNSIQVRIDENVRILAELHARWER
jgi:hypothetical protein